MDLKRLIIGTTVRACVYRVVGLLFVALAAVASSDASAQSSNVRNYPNQGAAYAGCMATAAQAASAPKTEYNYYGGGKCTPKINGSVTPPLTTGYQCTVTRYNLSGSVNNNSFSCNGVSASFAEHHDFDPAKSCAARPPFQAGVIGSTVASNLLCDNGCEVAPDSNTMKLRLDTRDASIFTAMGNYAPTGNVCAGPSAPPPREPAKDEFCSTLEGGGYQLCPQKNGQICVKSNRTGRKYCGNNDYPTVSTDPSRTESVGISQEAPAPGVPAPAPVPREGETFTPDSTASVTNTTTNTTTNVTNNINTGTPNTGGGSTPGDGSDNPGTPGSGGDGGDGGNEGSASGGGDCGSPPSCSGGDPATCQMFVQAWRFQCDSITDGTEPTTAGVDAFLAAGDPADPDMEGFGGPGVGPWTPDSPREWQETQEGNDLVDQLDDSGFLSARSCPIAQPVAVGGTSIPFTFQPICDLFINLSSIIEALGYFIGLGILLGVRAK